MGHGRDGLRQPAEGGDGCPATMPNANVPAHPVTISCPFPWLDACLVLSCLLGFWRPAIGPSQDCPPRLDLGLRPGSQTWARLETERAGWRVLGAQLSIPRLHPALTLWRLLTTFQILCSGSRSPTSIRLFPVPGLEQAVDLLVHNLSRTARSLIRKSQ